MMDLPFLENFYAGRGNQSSRYYGLDSQAGSGRGVVNPDDVDVAAPTPTGVPAPYVGNAGRGSMFPAAVDPSQDVDQYDPEGYKTKKQEIIKQVNDGTIDVPQAVDKYTNEVIHDIHPEALKTGGKQMMAAVDAGKTPKTAEQVGEAWLTMTGAKQADAAEQIKQLGVEGFLKQQIAQLHQNQNSITGQADKLWLNTLLRTGNFDMAGKAYAETMSKQLEIQGLQQKEMNVEQAKFNTKNAYRIGLASDFAQNSMSLLKNSNLPPDYLKAVGQKINSIMMLEHDDPNREALAGQTLQDLASKGVGADVLNKIQSGFGFKDEKEVREEIRTFRKLGVPEDVANAYVRGYATQKQQKAMGEILQLEETAKKQREAKGEKLAELEKIRTEIAEGIYGAKAGQEANAQQTAQYNREAVSAGAPTIGSIGGGASPQMRLEGDIAALKREIAGTKPTETGRLSILNQELAKAQQQLQNVAAPAAAAQPGKTLDEYKAEKEIKVSSAKAGAEKAAQNLETLQARQQSLVGALETLASAPNNLSVLNAPIRAIASWAGTDAAIATEQIMQGVQEAQNFKFIPGAVSNHEFQFLTRNIPTENNTTKSVKSWLERAADYNMNMIRYEQQRAQGKPDAEFQYQRRYYREPLKGSNTPQPVATGPKVGAVEDGYRFKGGDASKAENWEKVR